MPAQTSGRFNVRWNSLEKAKWSSIMCIGMCLQLLPHHYDTHGQSSPSLWWRVNHKTEKWEMQNIWISVMSYYNILTRIPQICHTCRPGHSGSGYKPCRSDRICVDQRRRGISNTVVIVPTAKMMDMQRRPGKWASLNNFYPFYITFIIENEQHNMTYW